MNIHEDGSTVILPEAATASPVEIARQKIEGYIKDEELDSVRFQAFADYVDYIDAEHKYGVLGKRLTYNQARCMVIEEVIRQRINGFAGYKKEFERVVRLKDDFVTALGENNYECGKPPKHLVLLLDIKNRVIKKRNSNR